MSEDLNDGRYRARGVAGAAEYGFTSKGTEQVAVLFELETGHRRTWYGYLSEKAVDRTLEALRACGVTDLETLAGIDSNEVEVVLQTEEFEGKWRQKVAFVNALGSGAVAMKARMDQNQRRSFAERMKGKWLNMGGSAAPKSEPTGDSDDIPF
jgi:hypothetical protein